MICRKLVSTNTNSKPSKNIPTERSSLNSPKAKAQKLPDSFPTGNASSQPIFIKTRQAPLSGNVVRGRNKISAKRSERRIRHTSSVDAEGMFQFDTTDEEETTFQSEVDESDNDGLYMCLNLSVMSHTLYDIYAWIPLYCNARPGWVRLSYTNVLPFFYLARI